MSLATTTNVNDLAVIALLAAAPLVIVFSLAIIRGYTITIVFTRRRRHDDNGV